MSCLMASYPSGKKSRYMLQYFFCLEKGMM